MWPVNSPHKGPVTRKMFSFDDVIMRKLITILTHDGNMLHINKSHVTGLESILNIYQFCFYNKRIFSNIISIFIQQDPFHYPCATIVICFAYLKPLSHSTAIPRRWHGDLKFLRAPWDRTKILKNIANSFTFSITWRCHGAPTATVAFPRSAHGVPPRSHGVLTGDWLRSHGALTACSWRAKSCHCASTACTQRARRAQCVSTASSRSVYEHMRKQGLQAYCRNRHAYNGSWVMWYIA